MEGVARRHHPIDCRGAWPALRLPRLHAVRPERLVQKDVAELVRIAPKLTRSADVRITPIFANRRPACYINDMPDKNLTDADRFPLSPRVQRWKALLAKLGPEPPAAAEPYSPPKAWVNSSIGQRKRRR